MKSVNNSISKISEIKKSVIKQPFDMGSISKNIEMIKKQSELVQPSEQPHRYV